MTILYLSIFHIVLIKIGWSQVEIWAGLGTTFVAAQQAGLKTQECQRNLTSELQKTLPSTVVYY